MSSPPAAAPRADRRVLKAAAAVLIILASAGLDQGAKSLARARLEGNPPVAVVGGLISLRWVVNEGAFLSLGAGFPRPVRMVTFVAFPLIVLGFMIGFLLRRQEVGWGTLAGLSLIVGGGAGNLIDRIFRDGRVGDFIMLGVGRLHRHSQRGRPRGGGRLRRAAVHALAGAKPEDEVPRGEPPA